jgi:serine protease
MALHPRRSALKPPSAGARAGSGLVALILFAGCGGGGSSDSGVQAPTNSAPTARLSLSTAAGPAPLSVTMDGSASSDSDGTINTYRWRFGDGTSGAIGSNTQHTYTSDGTYTVTLTVTDNDGASAQTTRTVTVEAAAGTASLSGSVLILSSSAIDSDVNDRLTDDLPNDDFATAQPIANPTSLGGFVNLPNTGVDTGNQFAGGDPADFYVVDLSGSETVLLDIAIDQPGRYFVEVFPVAGASNYVLSVGQDLAPTFARAPSRLSDPFVTGEIIVQAEPGSQVNPGAVDPALPPARFRLVREARSGGPAGLSPPPAAASQTPGRVTSTQAARIATLNAVKRLQARPDVRNAEPNVRKQPLLEPDDGFYNRQWHYPAINLPLAWDVTTGDPDVVVAVVDSGVLLDHPDLDGQLVPGYDFIRDPSRARDGDGIDPDPDDPGDLIYGASSSFHGTHVAGTVAAETDNGVGVAGVAWNARLMPLRALGQNGGTTYDVIQAMRYAAGLSNDSGTVPASPAAIINLSLGSSLSSQSEQAAIDEIRAAGVILVASAGNDGSDLPTYPAAYEGVVSVSATTIDNALAPYSNVGPTIDIAAPGGYNATDSNGDGIGDGVISTIGDDGSVGSIQFGYGTLNGTSMAAPHVAGVAALMKSVHPALTPAEFDAALLAGDLTVDLGAPGRDDRFGYGLINAQKAVLTALSLANGQGSDPGPVLSASSSRLNFGPFGTALDLTLSNVGSGSLVVASLTPTEPWLTVDPTDTDGAGLGSYRLQVDRSGLGDGTYTADLAVDTDANDLTVGIVMQVSSINFQADAGLHYIIAVDDNGDSAGPAAIVSVANGRYRFQLDDIPFGQYRLFGGTDSDDDNFLCDAGEACGAFRTLDSPDQISVNGDLTDLDFVSTFRLNLANLNVRPNGDADAPAGIAFDKPEQTKQPELANPDASAEPTGAPASQ